MSNFKIVSGSMISQCFRNRGVHSFEEACYYIRQLPYKRNTDKLDPECVFKDGFGTCSTKHATLKRLANENAKDHVRLMLGIFAMSKNNTPAIGNLLDKYGLDYIPEAHSYLYVDGQLTDCTKESFGTDFVNALMHEMEIEPAQITDFKVKYQADFIQDWLKNEKNIALSFDQIWRIREECIEALSV